MVKLHVYTDETLIFTNLKLMYSDHETLVFIHKTFKTLLVLFSIYRFKKLGQNFGVNIVQS